jgi:RNase H
VNRPVRNADLWMELDALVGVHKTNWIWTKGHAAHEDNNRCDWLAQNAARTQTSSWSDGKPHASLRLNVGHNYVPPKPQAGFFDHEDDDVDEIDPG